MIDLDDFEPIKAKEAIKRLLDGEKVFDKHGNTYYMNKETETMWFKNENTDHEDYTSLTQILLQEWYVEKPFDVRKTLIKNPNKWVAAYLGQECPHWFKIGFDLQAMSVVKTHYSFDVEVDDKSGKVNYLDDIELEEILDMCIDIEDVPQSEKDMLEQSWKTERITYISPKLQEYFNKKYTHLTEDDIEAILLSVEKKHEDEPYLPVGSKPYLITKLPYAYELEENIASLYGVNPVIPHLYDDEGVLFKKEKIKKG